MRDVLGPGTILGYCTNVHAGSSLEQIKANLDTYAVAVKRRVCPDEAMGIGLWFSAETVHEFLDQPAAVREFGDWLATRGLLAYTINGFPYGQFHQPVVKHDVYRPDWSQRERLEYTIRLAEILAALLPEGAEGSISTLPLGWAGAVAGNWPGNLADMIERLGELEDQTGRLIHIDLEPEPGCEIGDAQTLFRVMAAFESKSGLSQNLLRRHLRICHDVCHAAVMFEKPTRTLEWCRESGFRIGKVQISSAPRAAFLGQSVSERSLIRAQLERFVEPRYLHQTTIGGKDGEAIREFHEDLPLALQAHGIGDAEWRVHFHLPVYLESLVHLGTTQNAIIEFLRGIRPEDDIRHFEVETYAWNVLPPELQVPDLAEGIARELEWVKEQAEKLS